MYTEKLTDEKVIAAPMPEQASAGSLRKRFMHFYMYIAVYESRAALQGRSGAGHRGEKRLIPVHDMAEYEKADKKRKKCCAT